MNTQSNTYVSEEGELLVVLNNQTINYNVLIDFCDLTKQDKSEIIELFSIDSYDALFAYVYKWKPRIGQEHDTIMNEVNLANQIGYYNFSKIK